MMRIGAQSPFFISFLLRSTHTFLARAWKNERCCVKCEFEELTGKIKLFRGTMGFIASKSSWLFVSKAQKLTRLFGALKQLKFEALSKEMFDDIAPALTPSRMVEQTTKTNIARK
jgi:hypothetical protein